MSPIFGGLLLQFWVLKNEKKYEKSQILTCYSFLFLRNRRFAEFQFFGNSDADGFCTQAVLAEFLYLAAGAGLNLFSEIEAR